MSDTVKTGLLKTLETVLQGLPGIATIQRDCLFPLDLATIPLPALIFYEDLEDIKKGGRLNRNVIHLDLVMFEAFSSPVFDVGNTAWQDFKEAADQVAGEIHNLFFDPTALAALYGAGLILVEEVGNRKAPCNEYYGEMVLTVRLTYGHALGDAFTTQVS